MTGVIQILGAPSSAGAYAPGQEHAPQALRGAGLGERLAAAGARVEDRGDVPRLRWRPDRERPRAQNLAAVVATVQAVAVAVEAIVSAGDTALVLGGDCTVGIGTVAGVAAAGGAAPVGLVYLDLHGDLNTPASVPDGALDWMGVAHMLGEPGAEPELVGVGPRTPLLEPARLVLLGFRADQATAAERAAIERLRISVVGFERVAAAPAAAAGDALDRLSAGRDRLAVHFDVDVIDFTDAPLSENTGRNVGLTQDQAFAALAAVMRSPLVAALTITELNPDHGEPGGVTVDGFVARLVRALTP